MTTIHPYVAMAEISWRQERIRDDRKRSNAGRRDGARRHWAPRHRHDAVA
jgi:hypothetical protein